MTSKTPTPLCIRFKPDDRDRLYAAAKYEDKKRSVWIRETVIARADRVLEAKTWSKNMLTYETANGYGKQFCVRFPPEDYERIRLAAKREGAVLSTWIRAVLIERLDREPARPLRKRTSSEARA